MTGASNGQINDASAPFATGGGGGVTQIIAGTNITLSPSGGTGIVTVNSTGGGGGSPGGAQYDVQLNDGSGGFSGSNNLNFQGGYLTIAGDSGYGQLQWISLLSGGYGGAGINGVAGEIIPGAAAGDLSIWASQSISFGGNTGNAIQLRIDGATGKINIPQLTVLELTATDASKNLQSLDTATYPSLTEISYVKGVTSAIQTQLNTKGSGTVTSVTSSNASLTVTNGTTTPDIVINLAHSNIFTASQTVKNASLISASGEFQFTSETAPGAPTIALVATSSGNCTNGTHKVLVTFITAFGETQAGTASATVTVDATHKQISLTNIPLGTVGIVTGRNIWMTKAGGTTYFRLGASPTINDNITTTLTINIADGSLNSFTAPVNNTTGGNLFIGSTQRMQFDAATGFIGVNTRQPRAAFEIWPVSPTTQALILQDASSQSVPIFQCFDANGNIQFQQDNVNKRTFSAGFTSDLSGSGTSEHYGRGWTLSGTGSAAFGSPGANISYNYVTMLNNNSTGGDGATQVGYNAYANPYATVFGSFSAASMYGVAIGSMATAAYQNSCVIGFSRTTTQSDQAIIGYTDIYGFNAITLTAEPVNFHAPDASGTNAVGGDFVIKPGAGTGTGAGGNFRVKSAPPAASGSTLNTQYDVISTDDQGATTLTGLAQTIASPISGIGSIQYNDGSFTTGYVTDGATSRDYHIYAHSPTGGGIWSLAGSIAGAPFTDDNSTVSISGNPSPFNTSIDPGSSSYSSGDVLNYQIYAICLINGVPLVTSTFASDGFIINNTGDTITIDFTDVTYPIGSTSPQVFIARQLNSGGFNDSQIVAAGIGVFTDDSTGWGGTGTPTGSSVVQNFFQIDMSWSAVSGADDYKMIRTISAVDTATDLGNVTSFIDTGTLAWADSTTVTPNSTVPTTVVINGTSGAINVNAAYDLPNIDGSSGYLIKTDGAGQWGYVAPPTGTVSSVGLSMPGIFTVSGSPVTNAGTLTAVANGTSGGIPYFSSSSALASSGALTNHAIVLGGGAGASPTVLGSLGTATTVLHGNASGNPTFGAVSLTADVSGVLPVANGGAARTTGDLTGQTATASSVVTLTSPNDSNPHQYEVGAYVNVTAISAGTVTVTYTFMDENNVSRTLTLFPMGLTSATISATGFIAFPSSTIRVKANTVITLIGTFTGVSVSYDIGGNITRIN